MHMHRHACTHMHARMRMHIHTHTKFTDKQQSIREYSIKLLSHKGNLKTLIKCIQSTSHFQGTVHIHTIIYNTTLLPSVSILIARGMFCGAKYTHHTFTLVIKHLITTTANKHPCKKSCIDENMTNPTGIKLCISHKIATSRGPPLKSYRPNKSNYKNYLQQIN